MDGHALGIFRCNVQFAAASTKCYFSERDWSPLANSISMLALGISLLMTIIIILFSSQRRGTLYNLYSNYSKHSHNSNYSSYFTVAGRLAGKSRFILC